MKINKTRTYAAMTANKTQIRDNSMKLYSYLLCIAGKERYGNDRIFQHKNLILTQIQRYTGLSPKTIKLYLYELELNGLIEFCGVNSGGWMIYERRFIDENGHLDKKAFRKEKEMKAFELWRERKKDDYYKIPRPDKYTPIPEITLEKLNSIFEFDEIELKTYITFCIYRDIQAAQHYGKSKQITYEAMREILGLKDNSSAVNKKIKKTLYLLKGVGLIDFETGYFMNTHNQKIECFILNEVYYYVDYKENEWEENSENEDVLDEIKERLNQYDKSCYYFDQTQLTAHSSLD